MGVAILESHSQQWSRTQECTCMRYYCKFAELTDFYPLAVLGEGEELYPMPNLPKCCICYEWCPVQGLTGRRDSRKADNTLYAPFIFSMSKSIFFLNKYNYVWSFFYHQVLSISIILSNLSLKDSYISAGTENRCWYCCVCCLHLQLSLDSLNSRWHIVILFYI